MKEVPIDGVTPKELVTMQYSKPTDCLKCPKCHSIIDKESETEWGVDSEDYEEMDYEDYEDVNAIVYGLKYLEENDYSYRFARLGEDYDDYEEKYYDSDSEKENHLEFPSVLRKFEDEYIMDLMKVNDNLEK